MLKWDVDVVVHLQLDQWHESLFASQPKPMLVSHLIYLFVIYIKNTYLHVYQESFLSECC